VVALGEALYAMPIGGIEEILPMREVAPLPRSAPTVRGILFLRGHPVIVLDLGLLLGGGPARGTRIIVLLVDKERYGIVVDAVLKVAAPTAFTDVAEPPAALELTPALRGVARLGEEIVSLLDIDRLLPSPAGVRTGA
jgi:purine-binding chemotaxis protein CheW